MTRLAGWLASRLLVVGTCRKKVLFEPFSIFYFSSKILFEPYSSFYFRERLYSSLSLVFIVRERLCSSLSLIFYLFVSPLEQPEWRPDGLDLGHRADLPPGAAELLDLHLAVLGDTLLLDVVGQPGLPGGLGEGGPGPGELVVEEDVASVVHGEGAVHLPSHHGRGQVVPGGVARPVPEGDHKRVPVTIPLGPHPMAGGHLVGVDVDGVVGLELDQPGDVLQVALLPPLALLGGGHPGDPGHRPALLGLPGAGGDEQVALEPPLVHLVQLLLLLLHLDDELRLLLGQLRGELLLLLHKLLGKLLLLFSKLLGELLVLLGELLMLLGELLMLLGEPGDQLLLLRLEPVDLVHQLLHLHHGGVEEAEEVGDGLPVELHVALEPGDHLGDPVGDGGVDGGQLLDLLRGLGLVELLQVALHEALQADALGQRDGGRTKLLLGLLRSILNHFTGVLTLLHDVLKQIFKELGIEAPHDDDDDWGPLVTIPRSRGVGGRRGEGGRRVEEQGGRGQGEGECERRGEGEQGGGEQGGTEAGEQGSRVEVVAGVVVVVVMLVVVPGLYLEQWISPGYLGFLLLSPIKVDS